MTLGAESQPLGARWDKKRSVITKSTSCGWWVFISWPRFGGLKPLWAIPWAYCTVVPKDQLYSGESALPVESLRVSIVTAGAWAAVVTVFSGVCRVSVTKSGLFWIAAPSGRWVIVTSGCGCA